MPRIKKIVRAKTSQSRALISNPIVVPPPPIGSPWRSVFRDDFNYTGTLDPSKYFVYPNTWYDTSKNGRYSPEIITVSNGLADVFIHTENGIHKVAAFCPLPVGSLSNRGDLLGMATEIRIRADLMTGYKGVPLYWPISGNSWPYWGEINWPESDFDKQPSAFMHRQGATSGSDQDWYSSLVGTKWQDWHTYRVEWIPKVSCTFFQDGQVIGKSINRVPEGPMHWVLQFETNLAGTIPADSVQGHVQIDYIEMWSYNP